MELSGGVLKDFAGTIALMALLCVAYGMVMRICRRPWLGRSLLGLAFGLASSLAMFDPIIVAPGVIMDMRNLPIVMAGAFLGVEGMFVATVLALATRFSIGGIGAPAGAAALVLSGLSGLLWARWAKGTDRGILAMLGLAGLLMLHWAGVLLLPSELTWYFLSTTVPYFLLLEVLGALALATLLERERQQVEERRRLTEDAFRDGLTGLLNRRGFENGVQLLRGHEGGALLLLDVDHFKRINDLHGHPVGDAVLRALARRLASGLLPGQLLSRMGGEEFAVYLPGHSASAAREMARRLCAAVRSAPFTLPGGHKVSATVSVGGAWGAPANLDRLFALADAALYAAKHAGRDRCHFAGGGPVAVPSTTARDLPEGACGGCQLQDSCVSEGRARASFEGVLRAHSA